METNEKVSALIGLGEAFAGLVALSRGSEEIQKVNISPSTIQEGIHAMKLAEQQNPWFTQNSLQTALLSWSEALQEDAIRTWLNSYSLGQQTPLKVGVIMAGNIPLVGLHDALCVLLSGHILIAKPSSKDRILMSWVFRLLTELLPEWKKNIQISDRLNQIDVLIATGSNNSARYFDYYFKDQARIIRKNRTSIALISGRESKEDLAALAEDVFSYFGLGCRNVSKVFLPKGYSLDRLFEAFYPYREIIQHHKYANNYDYNKAVYLMNQIPLLENGFVLLKEDSGLHAPIGVLFYEYYDDLQELKVQLENQEKEIQARVGLLEEEGFVPFGKAQKPELWDYADGVDTMRFLEECKAIYSK